MSTFAASDILEFAIRIEKNGADFYKDAAKIAVNEGSRRLFEQLAIEEGCHRQTFEQLLAAIGQATGPEDVDGQYTAYMRSYVDNAVIFRKEALGEELKRVTDTDSAFDFAIRRELDSILYYHEIKRLVPVNEHATIDKIIEEERRHVTILSAQKEKQKP